MSTPGPNTGPRRAASEELLGKALDRTLLRRIFAFVWPYRGRLLDLSPGSIAIVSDGVRREFAVSDVDAITASRHGNLATGAKWGLGTGAGLGALLILMNMPHGGCYDCGIYFVGVTSELAGIGAGIWGGRECADDEAACDCREVRRARDYPVACACGRPRSQGNHAHRALVDVISTILSEHAPKGSR